MDRRLLYDALKKYWGYDRFRPSQLEAIESVCGGRDTLALMPTGAGKSLLYQIPALVSEGICIVVTPLISLMKDQTDSLRRKGVNAVSIHSGLTSNQIDLILDNCTWGDVKLLYISPERVTSSTFRLRFGKMNVSLLAVDEAHCISQWGYDFRPAYLRIAELRDIHPDVPVLALTASATPEVAEDIMRHLRMKYGAIVRSSFARPNLSFAVRRSDDKQGQLLRVAGKVAGSGIVYVRTRESAEKLSKWLTDEGFPSEHYHGGMFPAERSARQEKWMKGGVRIMVATNAFGMGIDKADVRFVVHYDIPDSPEAYYQEAGRAGRDGKRSYALLLVASDDNSRAAKRLETEYPPMEKIRECYEALFNYLQIGIGDGLYASFAFNIYEFASRARMYTGTAYSAIKILQQNGYMTLTDETDNPPRIAFTVGRDELYKVRIEREELDHIIRTLLRLYAGLFHYRLVPIDIQEIAHTSGYTAERVHELLKNLWDLRIIKYVPSVRSPILLLEEERLPLKDVYISPESYNTRKELGRHRLETMFGYAYNDSVCRSLMLQNYFGERTESPCGSCDVCLAGKKEAAKVRGNTGTQTDDEKIRLKVKEMLSAESMSVKDVVAGFSVPPDTVVEVMDSMCGDGEIEVCPDGMVRLKN